MKKKEKEIKNLCTKTDKFGQIQDTAYPFWGIYKKSVTNDKFNAEIKVIQCFFENWAGNFVHPFGNDLFHGKKLDNSVFYCYLASQSLVFDWLGHNLLFGAYELVLRELRSILEGLVATYSIDVKYPDQSLDEKLNILRIMENDGLSYGRKVFQKSGIDRWEDYYSLYRELSSYIHTSRKIAGQKMHQVAQKGFGEILDVDYDPDTFLKCFSIWMKAAMLAVNLATALLKALNVEIVQTPDPQIFYYS